jgi:hypothetical protein
MRRKEIEKEDIRLATVCLPKGWYRLILSDIAIKLRPVEIERLKKVYENGLGNTETFMTFDGELVIVEVIMDDPSVIDHVNIDVYKRSFVVEDTFTVEESREVDYNDLMEVLKKAK